MRKVFLELARNKVEAPTSQMLVHIRNFRPLPFDPG
jgi:hypothetical protein